jgi:hypothetical protein
MCSSPLCINLTEAAGFHAQMMGVLAGFALTCLVLIVGGERDQHPPSANGLIMLFVALVLLSTAAFLYGTAAGEEERGSRAASLILMSGSVAAVAMASLMFGLLPLVVPRFEELAELGPRAVALIVPVTTTFYLLVSGVDLLRVQSLPRADDANRVALVLLLLLAVSAIAVIQIGWHSDALRRLTERPPWSVEEKYLGGMALVFGAVSAGAFGLVMQFPELTKWTPILLLIIALMWLPFVTTYLLAVRKVAGWPGNRPQQSSSS